MIPFDMCLGLAVFFVVSNIVLMVMRYKKVPPNKVMVISGKLIHHLPTQNLDLEPGEMRELPAPRGYRIVRGSGVFVWPILETVGMLEANPLVVSIDDRRDYMPPSITVALNTEDVEAINRAASRVTDTPSDEIARLVQAMIAQVIDDIERNVSEPDRFEEFRSRMGSKLDQIGYILM